METVRLVQQTQTTPANRSLLYIGAATVVSAVACAGFLFARDVLRADYGLAIVDLCLGLTVVFSSAWLTRDPHA